MVGNTATSDGTALRVRLALGLGFFLYSVGAAIASHSAGPRPWGVHLLGFLPPAAATLVWTGLLLGTVFVFASGSNREIPGNAKPTGFRRILDPDSKWHLVSFLAVWGLALWVLRVRTNFLGDGVVWLSGLEAGEQIESHEPLAEAIWLAAAGVLRLFQAGMTASTVAPVSIACGVLAGGLCWLIAKEITRGGGSFSLALVLLLGIGTSQLFFGYIESYPPVAVAILWFLLAGIGGARTRSSIVRVAAILSIAIASHLACIFLIPGYVYLALRSARTMAERAAHLALPLVFSLSLLLLLGFGPQRWAETVRVASIGVQAHPSTSARDARPYPLLSLNHAIDLGNEILLVIPTHLLLICIGLASGYGKAMRTDPRFSFLTITGASGVVVASLLVLPVAPAQDWDLFALFLIPAGVLGAYLAVPLERGAVGHSLRRGVTLFALSTLGAFVLVNANTPSGVRRYETLVGPGAQITSFARTYGYEILAYFHRHNGDTGEALRYADALVQREPTNHRFWAMAGAIRMSRGDYTGAVANLEEAVRRGRNAGGTWTNLGICYTFQRRYGEALDSFSRAVAAEPDRPDRRLSLALSLLNSGRPDSARAVLSAIIRRWPTYTPARQALQRYFDASPRRN